MGGGGAETMNNEPRGSALSFACSEPRHALELLGCSHASGADAAAFGSAIGVTRHGPGSGILGPETRCEIPP